jgi:predicted transposase/invertase (TIGR01784 family)
MVMGKNVFATPLLDSTFKLVFGQKKHEQVTIDFLNDVLERTGTPQAIKEIVFTHQELPARKFDDKKSILDINCTDAQGNQFIIEIQRRREYYFDWRLLYYAASLLSRQLQETEPYGKLKPVIIIGILNFKLYPDFEEFISHHKICDMRTGKQSINLIELHIVELGKFNKKVDELISHIDKWLFFLKKAHEQEAIPGVYDDTPSIRTAFNVVSRWKWKPEQIASYDREVEAFRIDITQEVVEAEKRKQADLEMAQAIQDKAQAIQDKAQAIQDKEQAIQDKEQAIQDKEQAIKAKEQAALEMAQAIQDKAQAIQGKAQAIQDKAQNIAIALLIEGLSIDTVAKTTGLSIEHVEQLSKKI